MKLLASLTALTALALLSTASVARADTTIGSDKPAEPSAAPTAPAADSDIIELHYPPPITRLPLIALGIVISGGSWGASFASGHYYTTIPAAAQLKIPIVGPWIALGKSACASDNPNCSPAKVGVRGGLYVLDGIAQVAGLALITEAIVMKTESPSTDKKAAFLGLRLHGVEILPTPVASPSMTGLAILGTF